MNSDFKWALLHLFSIILISISIVDYGYSWSRVFALVLNSMLCVIGIYLGIDK